MFSVWLDHRKLAAPQQTQMSAEHHHEGGGAMPMPAADTPKDGVAMAQLSQLYVASLDGSVAPRLDNALSSKPQGGTDAPVAGVQRIGEVSIYQTDAVVRRAAALQKTRDGGHPVATLAGGLFDKLGMHLTPGEVETVNVAG